MVRWDSPLISIPWDEDPPLEAIWDVVIKGEKKGPTAAVMQVGDPSRHCFSRVLAHMAARQTSPKYASHTHQHHLGHHHFLARPRPSYAYCRFLPDTLTTGTESDWLACPPPADEKSDITGITKAQETIRDGADESGG